MTYRQADRQTDLGENITSLNFVWEVKMQQPTTRQEHIMDHKFIVQAPQLLCSAVGHIMLHRTGAHVLPSLGPGPGPGV